MFDKFVDWLDNDFSKSSFKYRVSFGRMIDLGSDTAWNTISIFSSDCSYSPIVTLLFCDFYSTLYLNSMSLFGVDAYGDMINQDIMQYIIYKMEDITGKTISDLYEK